MTIHELSRYYYLSKLIEEEERHVADLEARLMPGGVDMSGMPKNPSPKNMMEEIIPLIVELRDEIEKQKLEYMIERSRLERYIRSVEDYNVRLIMQYRFVDFMTWQQVARRVGGRNTADSVRKLCERYLKKEQACPKCPTHL